jgi:hypothetical protein
MNEKTLNLIQHDMNTRALSNQLSLDVVDKRDAMINNDIENDYLIDN